MRITAGAMRGRTMRVPDIEGLRPTPSRAREALFNILGDVQGYHVLDLFAGSGVMALEALSRGAASALSIDASRKACVAMRRIAEDWGVAGWRIQHSVLPKGLVESQHVDLVYADPPYQSGLAAQVPIWLAERHISYTHLVIEESSRSSIAWPMDNRPVQSRKYSETTLYFFAGTPENAS